MTKTQAQADCGGETFARPAEQDLRIADRAQLSPIQMQTLRRGASHWLTHAQRELHDALFAQDGSEASLDRYASARAELDSAEAWASRVARILRGG